MNSYTCHLWSEQSACPTTCGFLLLAAPFCFLCLHPPPPLNMVLTTKRMRKICQYPNCTHVAQKGGVCRSHGGKMKTCSQDGCPNNAVKNGICINHGATRKCTVDWCVKPLWMAGKCSRHYTIATKTSAAAPTTICTTAAPTMICTTILNAASSSANQQSPTCIDMTDIDKSHIEDLPNDILQNILQFAGGWEDWEWVLVAARVCKSWRTLLKPRYSRIGLRKMDGGRHRKLNAEAFLQYLQHERFNFQQKIYVPCGKARDLYVDDVRMRCPYMTELIHDKWLRVNRNIEFVQQGIVPHKCYRMYKHDMPNEPGKAWIKWDWDRKIKEVFETEFVVHQLVRTRSRKQTNFFINT